MNMLSSVDCRSQEPNKFSSHDRQDAISLLLFPAESAPNVKRAAYAIYLRNSRLDAHQRRPLAVGSIYFSGYSMIC